MHGDEVFDVIDRDPEGAFGAMRGVGPEGAAQPPTRGPSAAPSAASIRCSPPTGWRATSAR